MSSQNETGEALGGINGMGVSQTASMNQDEWVNGRSWSLQILGDLT